MDKEKQTERFVDFFRVERQRLIGYIRHRIEDTAQRDGEDIVQDVFFNVFNKSDITEPIENLTAYVYQAPRNRTIDLLSAAFFLPTFCSRYRGSEHVEI